MADPQVRRSIAIAAKRPTATSSICKWMAETILARESEIRRQHCRESSMIEKLDRS